MENRFHLFFFDYIFEEKILKYQSIFLQKRYLFS